MRTILIFFLPLLLVSCTGTSGGEKVVNVYSHRHYDIDQDLYDDFEAETGIKVNVVAAGADELIVRLKSEGDRSPADLLITSDAGRLFRAQEDGLLQPASSPQLEKNVDAQYRDPEQYWTALTVRARVIVYAPDRVDPAHISRFEDLADERWRGRIVARSSANEYNQSLLASLIAHNGVEHAEAWTRAIVANFARQPRGNDRDQVKSIATGEGDIAFVNTYYLAKMRNGDNAAERDAAASVGILFPNSSERGTHINISGAGVTRNAPNKEHALRLLEYMTSLSAQSRYAETNYEYPINSRVSPSRELEALGVLIPDTLHLSQLGRHNRAAVEMFNRAGWN